jgi:hypothetical protein
MVARSGAVGVGLALPPARSDLEPLHSLPLLGHRKGIQNSNGKWKMANGKPFEICYLPFAI